LGRMISKYKQIKGKEFKFWIFVNYPMVFALIKDNPPGLSYEGWRAVYQELHK